MKILLLNPPKYQGRSYIREGRCMQTKSSWAALWPPLSLSYTAAFLRAADLEVKLLDCVAQDISFSALKEIVSDFSPQLVVINSAFPTIYGDLKVIPLVKGIEGSVKTVLVGMVPTLLEEEIFKECADLDFLVVGEPEWTVRNLAEALVGKKNLEEIPGLVINKDGVPAKNKPQNFFENDPNELPFPARDLLDNSRYVLPVNGEKFTLLSVGRGCPYQCTFCSAKAYYSPIFRKRTPQSVVDEIEECVGRFGIKNFLFWGETFTLDRNYAIAIAEEIIKRNLGIQWATTSRADTVDKKMLSVLKKAGCSMLSLGIESTNDEELRTIKKGCTFRDTKRAIKLIGQAGIRRMGHFIFGLPFQTKEDCFEIIDFALKSGIEYAQFYCAVPYPKTELGELARKKGWVKEDTKWSDYDLTKSIMSNGVLTSREIRHFRNLAYRKFYLRPKMALQALKDVDSPLTLLRSFDFLEWVKGGND